MKAIIASLFWAFMANGVTLTDQEEARAQALMREIRCVACENEPISQSASDIAITMRERVRTMIAGGASDAEVRSWFADRYGEFVLFRPEGEGVAGWILWGTPFLLLVIGTVAGLAIARSRSGSSEPVEAVSPETLQDL